MNKNKYSANELKYLKQALGHDSKESTSHTFVSNLEKESLKLFGSKFCVAQNSGTSTLHSALLAVGVSNGDEVISPAFSVIMNTAVTLHCGAIPVYVDVDPETYCICPKDLKKKITPKTKAVQVVSVYGQSPEYDEIVEICNNHKIPIIEDNAETVFGYYKDKMVGTFGEFSSMSFEDSKHLSCGEGGLLLGNDEKLMTRVRQFAGQGFRTLTAQSGIVRLNPKEWQSPEFLRHAQIGYNYRITEFQAAIALAQIENINEIVFWRKKSGKLITELLEATDFFKIQATPDYIEHSFWCVGARLKRDLETWYKFRDYLFEKCGERVFGAWQVPYNEPVMQNGDFRRYLDSENNRIEYSKGLCPNAEEIQKEMMVFKTKYRNQESLDNFINGLEKTIKEFK